MIQHSSVWIYANHGLTFTRTRAIGVFHSFIQAVPRLLHIATKTNFVNHRFALEPSLTSWPLSAKLATRRDGRSIYFSRRNVGKFRFSSFVIKFLRHFCFYFIANWFLYQTCEEITSNFLFAYRVTFKGRSVLRNHHGVSFLSADQIFVPRPTVFQTYKVVRSPRGHCSSWFHQKIPLTKPSGGMKSVTL